MFLENSPNKFNQFASFILAVPELPESIEIFSNEYVEATLVLSPIDHHQNPARKPDLVDWHLSKNLVLPYIYHDSLPFRSRMSAMATVLIYSDVDHTKILLEEKVLKIGEGELGYRVERYTEFMNRISPKRSSSASPQPRQQKPIPRQRVVVKSQNEDNRPPQPPQKVPRNSQRGNNRPPSSQNSDRKTFTRNYIRKPFVEIQAPAPAYRQQNGHFYDRFGHGGRGRRTPRNAVPGAAYHPVTALNHYQMQMLALQSQRRNGGRNSRYRSRGRRARTNPSSPVKRISSNVVLREK